MAKATYAPGTEYLITTCDGAQFAVGGFATAQTLLRQIDTMWHGDQSGTLLAWDPVKKVSWNKIEAYGVLLNPETITCIADIRATDKIAKLHV